MYADSERSGVSAAFVHVAETARSRVTLGGVDYSYHQYPYKLLLPGVYETTPTRKLVMATVGDLLRHRSELVILPGYARAEHWAMLFICMLLGRKRAVWVDSTSFDRRRTPLKEAAKRFFFGRCDGFFCYGIRSKEYVESYGVDSSKIFFRCQAAALPPDYDAAQVRLYYKSAKMEANAPARFLYIGRLSEEKGLIDLLDAFALLRERTPNAVLDIVGSGVYERETREHAVTNGLEAMVNFLGAKNTEEIGQLLLRSSALVLPSHSEPWGLVVNEALSYGCPVVVSDVCGCVPELVLEGNTGYAYPSGNIPALAKAMNSVLELSKDRAAVATRCLDLIGQYSADRAAREILSGCAHILKSER
jgi:glycosyltransferase involved in cell wall biosynthesis